MVLYDYLIFGYTNGKTELRMKNEENEKLNIEIFNNLKNYLYEKYQSIIDLFICNYDEEKIIEFLKDSVKEIKNNEYYQYNNLNKYYDLIYSLLSLNDEYKVITKNNEDEKNYIRELLFVEKKYLYKLSNNCEDNNNDVNNNDNNKNNNNNNNTEICYITIKDVH